TSPAPGEVLLSILLSGGGIPNQAVLNKVLAKVSDKTIRPLTDHVTAAAPEIVGYDIDIVWYLHADDLIFKTEIESKVEQALADYVLWQKSKIGRDINRSELIARLKNAGAKRLEVTTPVYTKLNKTQIAIAQQVNLSFGGAEDG
ncbi:MAG: baseplate J/gp47 family protein, partial [Sporomusa sp.]